MDPSPTDLQASLAARVRALRRQRGWSRRALAAQTAISERFLADIETARANPSLQRLCELAAALGTTPHELLRPAPTERAVIALLGLRGAGKSSVGQRLATRLHAPFVELDRRVEAAAGLSLTEMFELHGESYYRETELAALRAVLDEPGPQVLATGGGLVTSAPAFALLTERAHTVWLRATPQDHWTRVIAQGDTRPMADNERAFADLCAILAEREPLYRQAALIVDTSGRGSEEIAKELAERFLAK